MRSGKYLATFFTIADANLHPQVYRVDLFLPLKKIWPSCLLVVFPFTLWEKKRKHSELTELSCFVTM